MPRKALLGNPCPKCGAENHPNGKAVILAKRTRKKTGHGNALRRRLRFLYCTRCDYTFKGVADSTTPNLASPTLSVPFAQQ